MVKDKYTYLQDTNGKKLKKQINGKIFIDWKNIVTMSILPEGIYRSGENPYQNSNGTFHRNRKSNPKFYIKLQNIPWNSQSNLKQEQS